MVQAGVREGRCRGGVGGGSLGGEGEVSLLWRLVIQRLLSARGRGGKAGHGDMLSQGLAQVARDNLEGRRVPVHVLLQQQQVVPQDVNHERGGTHAELPPA